MAAPSAKHKNNVQTAVAKMNWQRIKWQDYVVYIGFVVIFVIFSLYLFDDGFLSRNNLLNIVRQTATISVMAVAMTFVLGAAEIDLSIGAVAGLASVTTALTISGYGLVAGVLARLLTGALVG